VWLGWGGDGWLPGVAGEGGADAGQDVESVFDECWDGWCSGVVGLVPGVLRHAVEGFGPDYARSRALYLPDLAGAHALAGDTDTAVMLGHQAVEAVTAVHSPRVYHATVA
jgi:hypothetical protein